MCGIVGTISRAQSRDLRSLLQTMNSCAAHRGPDGEGLWFEKNYGIAHRRLTIIDPQTGSQPMATVDGKLRITYNGELYNFLDLRSELAALGHQFQTRSDTEVVLASYRQWGPECVRRFRGMFAFAIVDLERHQLFLARDHLGIKPLVFLDSPQFFAFASEIQSLHSLPGIDFDIDLLAIDDFLQLLYIPAPRTAFKNIHKLRPGHTLTVTLDGKIGHQQPFWRPEFRPDFSHSEDYWIEALDDVLRESVRSHLVSDVPFGAFLSGGLDSSAIVAYMSQVLETPVKAFTIGFDDTDCNEIPAAQETARRWDLDHHIQVLRPDALEILPDLVRHYGEPFGDSSSIPTFYLSRLAAQHVPMVLSGDGGDELFAGYKTHAGFLRWLHWDDRPEWRRLLYPLAQRLRPQRYLPRKPTVEAWLRFVHPDGPERRRRLWRPDVLSLIDRIPHAFEEERRHVQGLDPIQMAQYLDLRTYLPNDILTKVDVAGMMSSLEVRTPLVDHRVVDFVSTIPPEFNIRRNEEGVFEGKLLLKRLLSRYYPESFVRQRKRGFAAPVSNWLGPGQKRSENLRDRLMDSNGPLLDLFQPQGINAVIRSGASTPIWQLLFLDEWMRQQRKNS